MKITKFGHCCLLIDIDGTRILTDPAMFSKGHESLKNIDVVLITHEHPDHFHLEALKVIMQNNPSAKVITNSAVEKLMEGMAAIVVGDTQSHTEKGILFEGFGTKHAPVYADLPTIENTGYFIANKLFYPGDAFTNPGKPVDILAVPTSGPWMKLSEAIDYAKSIKPRICFPVHDGLFLFPDFMNQGMKRFLEPEGIKFVALEIGTETDI